MGQLKQSRRQFLATTAIAGATGLFGLRPARGRAATKLVRVRIDRDIGVLDPGYMVGGSEIEVQKAVLPVLVDYTYRDGELGWGPSPYVTAITQRDATHIDFTLKPGLMWTNGFGELSAEDVKYSFERMKTSDWSGNYDPLERVDVKDSHSGTLVLKEPYAPFISTTLASGTGAVLSRKAVEQAGGKFTTEIPATCGPYLYKWTPKQRIVFQRNPEWTGPRPDYDEIRGLLIEEDKAAELAYEAEELEVTEITSATLARYRKTPPPDSKIQVAGALQYMWLGMNTQHPKLQDIRVRKAIQHAVDVDSIIQGAYSGTTERSYGIVCPGLIGKRDASKYDYNPDKARALLSEAGVSGLQLDLRTLNLQDRILTAQIIQANLQAVGITAKVLPMDSGPFWDMGLESKGDMWKDLQLWIMRYGTNPDPQEATQWFRRDQVGVWNWERWSDDEYEELYKKGLAESDPAKRAQIYLRMQEIMEDTGAYVWINHEQETFIHRTSVAISVAPSGEMHLREFKAV